MTFLAQSVKCMLIRSDGEKLMCCGCQMVLAERCCSALSSLHCTNQEWQRLEHTCFVHFTWRAWVWGEKGNHVSHEWYNQSRERRLFSYILRKLISKVALLCSRTHKAGHCSISSSHYKNWIPSQRDADTSECRVKA